MDTWRFNQQIFQYQLYYVKKNIGSIKYVKSMNFGKNYVTDYIVKLCFSFAIIDHKAKTMKYWNRTKCILEDLNVYLQYIFHIFLAKETMPI